MKPVRLVLAAAFAVLAFDLGRALVTHQGVGVAEWIIGVALVVLLAGGAATYGRRSRRA